MPTIADTSINATERKDKTTMTKMEFAQVIADMLPNGMAKEVEKTNGVKLIGVCFGEGDIRPNVYIDKWYEEGKSATVVAEEVKRIANNSIAPIIDTNAITDYAQAKDMLVLRLYNNKTNAEVFKSASEYGFDDLILVPYVQISPEAATKVTDGLLKVWGVDTDTVFADAMENTKGLNFNIRSMSETMKALMPEMAWMFPEVEEGTIEPQYTITVGSKLFGAVGAIIKRNELMQKFPDGYYVLPSSVHEVIIMPKAVNTMSKGDLDDMVVSVNEQELKPEEMLGYKAYEF